MPLLRRMASFNTFGACHQMNLDGVTVSTILGALQERLQRVGKSPERNELEAGQALFMKIQNGNAKQGWYATDGPVVVKTAKVIGPITRAWLHVRGSFLRKPGRNPWM
jgi:hypothetical protein